MYFEKSYAIALGNFIIFMSESAHISFVIIFSDANCSQINRRDANCLQFNRRSKNNISYGN